MQGQFQKGPTPVPFMLEGLNSTGSLPDATLARLGAARPARGARTAEAGAEATANIVAACAG